MKRALREKLLDLMRGEDGVALVVTLALFFFMYLLIAGVYAIGTAVKQRIQLQNAVDAAAYSAAVVQADTLSRIATVNRAMAWTYAQMVRRQQDYITWKWLYHAVAHYNSDLKAAKQNGDSGAHGHPYYYIGADLVHLKQDGDQDAVRIKRLARSRTKIERHCSAFKGHLTGSSFYCQDLPGSGIGRLTDQIVEDKESIKTMGEELQRLRSSMPAEIRNAVQLIARHNLGTNVKYAVKAEFPGNFLSVMKRGDENRFLQYAGETDADFKGWFGITDCEMDGFQRSYGPDSLVAQWRWWTGSWTCSSLVPCVYKRSKVACGFCSCGKTAITHDVSVSAQHLRDEHFDGVPVRPLIMGKEYFGPAGTITVGLSVLNRNPWSSIMSVGGLYRAFDHYCDRTVVFASAKAGYRVYDENKPYGRDYRIDWLNESNWNLYTSDWDAVMVPVRMADYAANGGNQRWLKQVGTGGNVVQRLVASLNVQSDAMLAGGDAEPDISTFDGQMYDDSSIDRWRWYNWQLKQNTHNAGKVQSRWRIENPGGRLTWAKLADRMFH